VFNIICLGELKSSTDRSLSLSVYFDENGLFHKFNVGSSKGSLDISEWKINFKGVSNVPMVNELCRRLDLVISVNNNFLNNLPVKMSEVKALMDIGVGFDQIKRIGVKLKGRSFYKVISNDSNKIMPPTPPCREDFDSHQSFREELDRYMEVTAVLRIRMSKELQAIHVRSSTKDEPNSYFTYSSKIAEYSFLNEMPDN
jgi:hypothetical protein